LSKSNEQGVVDLQQRSAKLLKVKAINGVGVFGQLFQQKLASFLSIWKYAASNAELSAFKYGLIRISLV
jgi:hypothetical protein